MQCKVMKSLNKYLNKFIFKNQIGIKKEKNLLIILINKRIKLLWDQIEGELKKRNRRERKVSKINKMIQLRNNYY